MKHIFTLFFILLFSYTSFSQTRAKYQYLTIQMKGKLDLDNDEFYLSLVSEKDNPNSAFIDSLIAYKPKLRKSSGTQFYSQRKDFTQPLFNYFKSTSECLQFLDEQGWELFQVYGDTGGSNNSVVTQPIYYLRKVYK